MQGQKGRKKEQPARGWGYEGGADVGRVLRLEVMEHAAERLAIALPLGEGHDGAPRAEGVEELVAHQEKRAEDMLPVGAKQGLQCLPSPSLQVPAARQPRVPVTIHTTSRSACKLDPWPLYRG